jgi:hypothetical protein
LSRRVAGSGVTEVEGGRHSLTWTHAAIVINFRYLAKAVVTSDEVIDAMNRGQKEGTPRGI